jgi:Cupin-like domain
LGESDRDLDNEPAAKQPKMSEVVSSDHSQSSEVPEHFCRVKLPEDDVTDLRAMFSDQLSAEAIKNTGCLIAEIEEGEMLYLPASWFHEVSKMSPIQLEMTQCDSSLHVQPLTS